MGETGAASKPTGVLLIGYQGRSVSDLIAKLCEHRVSVLCDVRLTPVSRRHGFSRAELRISLVRVGIEYVHEPTLGNPKDNRAAFQSHSQQPEPDLFSYVGDCSTSAFGGGINEAHDRYRECLRTVGRDALSRLISRAAQTRVALLCYEEHDRDCHRSLIAEAIPSNLGISISAVNGPWMRR